MNFCTLRRREKIISCNLEDNSDIATVRKTRTVHRYGNQLFGNSEQLGGDIPAKL